MSAICQILKNKWSTWTKQLYICLGFQSCCPPYAVISTWVRTSTTTAFVFVSMHVCKMLHALCTSVLQDPTQWQALGPPPAFCVWDSLWDFVQLEPLHVMALVPSCPFTHNNWSSWGTLILTLSRHGLLPTWGLFVFSLPQFAAKKQNHVLCWLQCVCVYVCVT